MTRSDPETYLAVVCTKEGAGRDRVYRHLMYVLSASQEAVYKLAWDGRLGVDAVHCYINTEPCASGQRKLEKWDAEGYSAISKWCTKLTGLKI